MALGVKRSPFEQKNVLIETENFDGHIHLGFYLQGWSLKQCYYLLFTCSCFAILIFKESIEMR